VRCGQLWDVATHFGLESSKLIAQGRFAEAEARVERLSAMEEGYAYDLATSNRHAVLSYLHAERRQLEQALAAAETYLGAHHERLLNLLALSMKAKVQVLSDDLDGADATLRNANDLLQGGRVPPFHLGFCVRSRLMLNVALLERDGVVTGQTSLTRRRAVRDALWASARVAWLRPEVFRAVGRAAFLEGRRRHGLRWLSRALDEADRLSMRPEAARVRYEIARCLTAAGSGAQFRGQDARTLLRDAQHGFEAFELTWESARAAALG
jgi:hypothetical protein